MTYGIRAGCTAWGRKMGMAPLLALALVAAVPVAAPADVSHEPLLGAQWREIGPFPIEPGDPRTYSQFATTTGRVTAVAVSPTNADHVFIGGAIGGVWRSRDGGQSWEPILDDADTLAVDSLAIDTEGTLWVGTGSYDEAGVGLYRIPDAATGSLQVVRSSAEGPLKDRVAGTGMGDEPSRSAFAGTVIKAIAIDPNDPDRMFVATFRPHNVPYPDLGRPGLYYTKNARAAEPGFSVVKLGDRISEVDVTDVEFVPGSSDELLVAVVNRREVWGIWRTDNATAAAGDTVPRFVRVKPIADEMVLDRYTVLTASKDVVYAATSERSGTIYKSTDRGRTFFRDGEKDADGTTPFSSSAYGWGFGSHHGTIAVDPSDPDNVYLGGEFSCARRTDDGCPPIKRVRTILHSSDGGKRFHIADGPYRSRPEGTGIQHAYVHPDVTDFAFAPSDPDVIYNANDGGIYRADNGGVQEPPDADLESYVSDVYFETRNTDGLGLTQFYNLAVHPRDRHFTMGGTQDNGGVIQRTSGGKWRFVGGGDIFNVAIDQTATSTDTLPLYVDCVRYDTTDAALLQKVDQWMPEGCSGWGSFWAQGPGATLTAPDIMYWGKKSALRRTADKGVTDSTLYDACSGVTPCPSVTAAAASATTPGRLLVGTSDGALRLIRPDGDVWDFGKVGEGAPITAIAFDARGDHRAYVGVGGHLAGPRIWSVYDADTPYPIFVPLDLDAEDNPQLPRLPINSIVIDPLERGHIFVGTDSGVFASVDDGATWNPLGEGLPRGCERKGEICGTRFKVRSARSMAITRNMLRVASYGRGMWEIQIAPDRTPPQIRFESQTPPPNAAGWNNGQVVLEWSCTDDESAVKSERVIVTLSKEGEDQTAQGVCEDALGNRATQIVGGIDIDLTAPQIRLVQRPAANAAGWHSRSVTLVWACQDVLSGAPVAEVRRTLDNEGADQSARATCTDRAGNDASDTQTNLNVDLTPPSITLADRPAANGNGWYRDPVTIRWSCSDALSGAVSPTVAVSVTAEGADQSAEGVCADRAGHRSTNVQENLDIDLTRPVVTYSEHPTELTVAEAISITCRAEDALSGIASHTCRNVAGEGYEFPVGQTVLSADATDRAGNTGSATTSFMVRVDADSLCVLTRRWVTSSQVATSLCTKLKAAETARMMGNDQAAEGQLLAFRQQLEGQVGNTITQERADILLGLSHYL